MISEQEAALSKSPVEGGRGSREENCVNIFQVAEVLLFVLIVKDLSNRTLDEEENRRG